jgi:hypothetical protein
MAAMQRFGSLPEPVRQVAAIPRGKTRHEAQLMNPAICTLPWLFERNVSIASVDAAPSVIRYGG